MTSVLLASRRLPPPNRGRRTSVSIGTPTQTRDADFVSRESGDEGDVDDDEQSESLTLRQRARHLLYHTRFRDVEEALQTIASLGSCVIFVQLTYDMSDSEADTLLLIETIFTIFFIWDYSIRFFAAEKRRQYPFTTPAIVDLLSIVPVVVRWATGTLEGLSFVRILRVLRTARIVRAYLMFLRSIRMLQVTEITRQVVVLTITFIGFIFLGTGLLHVVEYEDRDIHFHDSMYFMIVTLSTVGYGDISPLTFWGRFITMILIVIAAILVPIESFKILHLFSMKEEINLHGRFTPARNTHHVVVCGFLQYDAIASFLKEFYHSDHRNVDARVVFLSLSYSDDLIELAQGPRYKQRVVLLTGDCFNSEDLKRARMDKARACFIFVDKQARDPAAEDATTTMCALAISRMAANVQESQLRLYVQLIRSQHQPHVKAAGADQVTPLDAMKLALLAKSVVCPGLSTLITNLIVSYAFRRKTVRDYIAKNSDANWRAHYEHGRSNELYRIKFPGRFRGKRFVRVTRVLYRLCSTILIAIEKRNGSVVLNPGPYRLSEGDYGIVIAQSKLLADSLSLFLNRGGEGEWPRLGSIGSSVNWSNILKGKSPIARDSSMQAHHLSTLEEETPLPERRAAPLRGKLRNAVKRVMHNGNSPSKVRFTRAVELAMEEAFKADMSFTELESGVGWDSRATTPPTPRRSDPSDGESASASDFGIPVVQVLDSLPSSPGFEERRTGGPVEDIKRKLQFWQSTLEDKKTVPEPPQLSPRSEVTTSESTPSDGRQGRARQDWKPTPLDTAMSEDIIEEGSGVNDHSPVSAAATRRRSRATSLSAKSMKHDIPCIVPPAMETLESTLRSAVLASAHHLNQHTLVIGWATNLDYFLHAFHRAVRHRHSQEGGDTPSDNTLAIVVLTPQEPSKDLWMRVCDLPQTYFVVGNPHDLLDVERAGVRNAKSVVILANPLGPERSLDQPVIDADAILSRLSVTETFKSSAFVITELIHSPNISFLPHSNFASVNPDPYSEAPFAAGHAYSTSMLDSLACQTYFNPHVTGILDLLILSHQKAESDSMQLELVDIPLNIVELPEEQRVFSSLFEQLIVTNVLAIGLYCAPDLIKGNELPFVLTNPLPHTRLSMDDKVYILAQVRK